MNELKADYQRHYYYFSMLLDSPHDVRTMYELDRLDMLCQSLRLEAERQGINISYIRAWDNEILNMLTEAKEVVR
jgi:hypothetical protein